MGTEIHVTDGHGNPIDDAVISCGGCTVNNAGDGFYSVGVNLTPFDGGFGVAAPGKTPEFYNWYTNLAQGGNIALQDIAQPSGKWW